MNTWTPVHLQQCGSRDSYPESGLLLFLYQAELRWLYRRFDLLSTLVMWRVSTLGGMSAAGDWGWLAPPL